MNGESDPAVERHNHSSLQHQGQPSSDRPEKKIKGVALKIVLGCVAAILIIITVYISGIRNKYKSELVTLSRQYNRLRERDAAISKLKLQRVAFFGKRAFLDHPGLSAFSAAAFIRKLSLITTRNLNLLELRLDLLDQKIGFVLKGRISGIPKIKTTKVLDRFYQKLNSMDDVIQVVLSPLEQAERSQMFVEFVVKGELEAE